MRGEEEEKLVVVRELEPWSLGGGGVVAYHHHHHHLLLHIDNDILHHSTREGGLGETGTGMRGWITYL